jgi:hypothetical protein
MLGGTDQSSGRLKSAVPPENSDLLKRTARTADRIVALKSYEGRDILDQ